MRFRVFEWFDFGFFPIKKVFKYFIEKNQLEIAFLIYKSTKIVKNSKNSKICHYNRKNSGKTVVNLSEYQ